MMEYFCTAVRAIVDNGTILNFLQNTYIANVANLKDLLKYEQITHQDLKVYIGYLETLSGAFK